MNLLHTLLLLFLLPLTALAPSAALGPATPSLATAPFPSNSGDEAPASSISPATPSSGAPAASFASLTTTNAQGSIIVTTIPITVAPSTTPTSTSSTPYPSLSGYPACVTNCLTDAVAQVNCTSITAVACYCTNQTFPNTLYTCVVSNCSSSVPSAENLARQFCAIDNVTLSFASTAAPSTSSPSSASRATATSQSSSSSKSQNAAPAGLWMLDARGWTGMALAACGVMFGAAFL